MNRATPRCAPLERLLAGTLHYGTWLASAAIGLGLALALIDSRFSAAKLTILRDMRIATVGIALLILLPVVRVIVMLIAYLRQRDYHLSAIALLVLTIILLGFAVGLAGSKHRDTPGISDSGVRRNSSTSHDASYRLIPLATRHSLKVESCRSSSSVRGNSEFGRSQFAETAPRTTPMFAPQVAVRI